jgi:hypothetical protein
VNITTKSIVVGEIASNVVNWLTKIWVVINGRRKMIQKPPKKKGRHRQTIACDISPEVKKKVWERDGHCCIICGNTQAMPNSHYIRRSRQGLGIEQNVVTMCEKCHHETDNGDMQEIYRARMREYLMAHYPDWNEEDLIYKK